jgi:hypothetical protein
VFSSDGLAIIKLSDGSATNKGSPWGTKTPLSVARIGSTLYISLSDSTIHSVGLDGTGDLLYAGVPGMSKPPSTGPRLSAVMQPTALGTDGTNLYFVDGNNLIRMIDSNSGEVKDIAGSAGTKDVVEGAGTAAHFASPLGLACDGPNLYTIDGSDFSGDPITGTVVRKIEIATRKVTNLAGQAFTPGFADGIGSAALFGGALSLATDGKLLFIADVGQTPVAMRKHFGPAIRELNLADNSVTTMIGTPGQWTFLPGTGSAALVNIPEALVYDSTNHAVYFHDAAEHVFGRIN